MKQIESGKITARPPKPTVAPELEEMIEGISELLNKEINDTGKIQHNNNNIWQVLHKMDDSIWDSYLAALEIYANTRPAYAGMSSSITKLQRHLDLYRSHYSPWTLTPYEGMVRSQARPQSHRAKGAVWSVIQQAREAYCVEKGIDLPNEDSSKGRLNPTPTQALFDWGNP